MAELAFIETVAERAGVPEDQAVALIEATLRTLTERISAGEAADAAAHMPDRFRPLLIKSRENAEAFPIDEFIRRVAERAGVGPDVAERVCVRSCRPCAIWSVTRSSRTSCPNCPGSSASWSGGEVTTPLRIVAARGPFG